MVKINLWQWAWQEKMHHLGILEYGINNIFQHSLTNLIWKQVPFQKDHWPKKEMEICFRQNKHINVHTCVVYTFMKEKVVQTKLLLHVIQNNIVIVFKKFLSVTIYHSEKKTLSLVLLCNKLFTSHWYCICVV